MKKLIYVFLVTGITCWLCSANAQGTPGTKSKAEAAVKAMIDPADDDKEHDITGSTVTEYQCELGSKITIYENSTDDLHIGMRWLNTIHRLTRVGTSTGANRFENKKAGLVWIGIPAKGMLLDSKKGKQLANECRTAEQIAEKKANAKEPPKTLGIKSK